MSSFLHPKSIAYSEQCTQTCISTTHCIHYFLTTQGLHHDKYPKTNRLRQQHWIHLNTRQNCSDTLCEDCEFEGVDHHQYGRYHLDREQDEHWRKDLAETMPATTKPSRYRHLMSGVDSGRFFLPIAPLHEEIQRGNTTASGCHIGMAKLCPGIGQRFR